MSVSIAEPAGGVEERGENNGVAVEDPRHRPQIGVTEGRADFRERDVDDEQVQAGQKGRDGHDENHQNRCLGTLCCHKCHVATPVSLSNAGKLSIGNNTQHRKLTADTEPARHLGDGPVR